MIGMHICAGHRLYRVGMLGIGRLIFRPFGPALLSLRPLILQPHFDSLSQCFLGAPSLASSEGFATQLKQETPIAPLAIGQQRQITRLLDDVTQKAHGIFNQLAVFPSTLHVPKKTCRPIHQHNRPSL